MIDLISLVALRGIIASVAIEDDSHAHTIVLNKIDRLIDKFGLLRHVDRNMAISVLYN